VTADQGIEALRLWFGPSWKWSEIALWIEARAKSGIPDYAKVWAFDYLRQRRAQEKIWQDERKPNPSVVLTQPTGRRHAGKQ